MAPRKLLLVNHDGLSDTVLLTALVRDFQRATGGEFLVDVHTRGMPLWLYNQHISRLDWRAVSYDGSAALEPHEYALPGERAKLVCYDPEIQVVQLSKSGHFAASESLSHINAYHAIHSFAHDISQKLGLSSIVPIGEQKGDVILSDVERGWVSQVEELGIPHTFWVVSTGGVYERSAQWWDPVRYQRVVDEFQGKITFVQVGLADEHHPKLRGVVDLVGKTDLRQLVRLMYHAGGYLGPANFLMHLAAAVPVRPFDRAMRRRAPKRAAVIIAGGREPSQWIAYEGHQVVHTNGMLPCCAVGGCGKTRCEVPRPLEPNPESLCSAPVSISRGSVIPRCLDMITPRAVIDRIQFYYEGGSYSYNDADAGTEKRGSMV